MVAKVVAKWLPRWEPQDRIGKDRSEKEREGKRRREKEREGKRRREKERRKPLLLLLYSLTELVFVVIKTAVYWIIGIT